MLQQQIQNKRKILEKLFPKKQNPIVLYPRRYSSDEVSSNSSPNSDDENIESNDAAPSVNNSIVIWKEVVDFVPRFKIPKESSSTILADVHRGSTELDVFLKLMPRSLFTFIFQCTNQRLKILAKVKKTK